MSHHSSHLWGISGMPRVWSPSYPTTESVDGSTANGICNFLYNLLSQYKLSQMCTVESGVLFLFGLTFFFFKHRLNFKMFDLGFSPLSFYLENFTCLKLWSDAVYFIVFFGHPRHMFYFWHLAGKEKKGEYFRREAICHLPSGLP